MFPCMASSEFQLMLLPGNVYHRLRMRSSQVGYKLIAKVHLQRCQMVTPGRALTVFIRLLSSQCPVNMSSGIVCHVAAE